MTALDLTTNVYFDNPFDTTGFEVIITPADETLFYLATMPSNKWQFLCFLNAVADPANGIFNTIQDAIDYNITANSTAILDYFASLTPPIIYTSIGTVYKNIYNGIISYGVPETRTVNGHALSGDVTVTKSDISLGNVDNTTDANKPVSTATQTALNLKASISSLSTVATSGSYNDLSNKPTIISPKAYEGTTLRTGAFPVFKSATVASGVAVFNLTSDGTSTGTALFTGGVIQDSVNAFVSDAAASYQMAYAFSNSNKTVTVTTNKLTTANILTGLLGQAAGNGSVVKLSVWGY